MIRYACMKLLKLLIGDMGRGTGVGLEEKTEGMEIAEIRPASCGDARRPRKCDVYRQAVSFQTYQCLADWSSRDVQCAHELVYADTLARCWAGGNQAVRPS